MSKQTSCYNKPPCVTVYLTKEGLMEEIIQQCDHYGYSLSKFGQAAIIEKMERERERKGVMGSTDTTPVSHPSTPTPTPNPTTISTTYRDNGGLRS